MEERITINLNDVVFYKPNERTEEALRKNYNDLWGDIKTPPYPFEMPEADEEGFIKTQLWNFMESFGHHISLGKLAPIETLIEFRKVDLKPTPTNTNGE